VFCSSGKRWTRQVRINEGADPSLVVEPAHFPTGAAEGCAPAHRTHHQAFQRRPLVLRRQRTRCVLLRSGDDRPARQRRPAKGRYLLSRWQRRRAAEGLGGHATHNRWDSLLKSPRIHSCRRRLANYPLPIVLADFGQLKFRDSRSPDTIARTERARAPLPCSK